MPSVGERLHVIVDRAAARSRYLDRLGDRHPTALARQLQNPDRQRRQITQHNAFALDRLFQGPLLLLQRPKQEHQSKGPVRLGAPYRPVGSLRVPLDDALE